jgi:hypothetical protein
MNDIDLTAFGFQGTNPLWDAIHQQLELYEQTETVMALDIQPQGETRAYLAGKAAALGEFREHLKSLRRQALDG